MPPIVGVPRFDVVALGPVVADELPHPDAREQPDEERA